MSGTVIPPIRCPLSDHASIVCTCLRPGPRGLVDLKLKFEIVWSTIFVRHLTSPLGGLRDSPVASYDLNLFQRLQGPESFKVVTS